MLCKWHCSRVEPAVNYFRYTVHLFSTFRTLDGDFINIRSVQLYSLGCFISAHLEEFLTASDGVHMSAFTFPDVQRSSPVTVTGNTPVLYVLQPVTETSFSDTFRNPVDGVVVADQIIFDCCHLDEPGFTGIVDQRSITSPTVWIFMLKFRSIKQQASCIQIF